MRPLGLLEIERLNAITMKRIELIQEYEKRSAQPPHPRVGVWRHNYNLTALASRITLLDVRRLEIIKDFEARHAAKTGTVETSNPVLPDRSEVLRRAAGPS